MRYLIIGNERFMKLKFALISTTLISITFAPNSRDTPERIKPCFIRVEILWYHGHCEEGSKWPDSFNKFRFFL